MSDRIICVVLVGIIALQVKNIRRMRETLRLEDQFARSSAF